MGEARPVIPKKCPQPVNDLLQRCWAPAATRISVAEMQLEVASIARRLPTEPHVWDSALLKSVDLVNSADFGSSADSISPQ
jgi:hypothetical protein